MSRLSKHHIWDWFRRHNAEYRVLQNKTKKEAGYWLEELNAHLRAYYKFLEFSIDCPDNEDAVLTVSVGGKAQHFKKAEDLVAKAPQIPGWKIVALEQPRPIDFFLEPLMQATGIDPREFHYSFSSDNPGDKGLLIFHPLCTAENEHQVLNLARSAVYNLLGERAYGTEIAWMEAYNLSTAKPDQTEKLESLPEALSMRRSGMSVDSKGNLAFLD